MNLTEVSLYFVLLCVILVGIRIVAGQVYFQGTQESLDTISRHIQNSFTLRNKKNKIIKDAQFWTYDPGNQTPAQRFERIESSYPYELIGDNLGNQVLNFTFNNFHLFATKILTIKADLFLCEDSSKIILFV